MEPVHVTLIIKAPNQQIEDQKIDCELSWTVSKLKAYISEVYPGRPVQHEQKLIYSGQLLQDSVILKDILRQYPGQDNHILHLVCLPKHATPIKQKDLPISGTSIESNVTEMPSPPLVNVQTTDSNPEPTLSTPQTDFMQNVEQMAPFSVNPYQMMYIQQVYALYISSYIQLINGGGSHQYQGYVSPQNVNALPNEAANLPQPPPAVPPQQPPVEENPERDWLDVFYMLSRLMVLFSVVYFYSSPVRFILVFFLGIALYLYQMGFLRTMINNNHINNPPYTLRQDQAPSRIMIVWTFFTTFFASLIPEVPNAI